MSKGIVLYNGKIVTLNKNNSIAESLLIEDNLIKDINMNMELIPPSCNDYIFIDLKGRTVLPGFYDSHIHLVSTFLSYNSINLNEVKSIEDIQSLIQKKARENPGSSLIYGGGISSFKLKETRYPTKLEIDKIAPNIPVVLASVEYHTVILNSCAMRLFKIPFTTDFFEKDSNGSFTGVLKNRASALARKKMFQLISEEDYSIGIKPTFDKLIQKGVTTVIAVEGGHQVDDRHINLIMKNKNKFPIDVEVFCSTTNLRKITQYNFSRVGGDILLDGSFRSKNAALFEGYENDKENKGKLFFSKEELIEFIRQANGRGLQVSIHAVGTRAIDLLLNAYEEALSEFPRRDHRHRIEHFELPTYEQIQKAAKLNLVLAMHPNYEYFFREENEMYINHLGRERSKLTNPFRAILDSGIIIAGCSDSDAMPIDPMLSIHSCVNHPNPDSRITPLEAIKMHTYNGAYSIFEENKKGSIEINKIADLIVLDKDPLTVSKHTIKDIEVLLTIKNGKVLYNNLSKEEVSC